MKEVWIRFNELFNFCGGLISTISFIVSILIFFKTGQIKKNIKNMLSHDKYVVKRKAANKNLEGILASIEKDKIFDNRILGEIHREISSLEHYSIFFDIKMQRNMKSMKRLLEKYNKNYNNKNKNDILRHEFIMAINKILGDLDIDDIYLG